MHHTKAEQGYVSSSWADMLLLISLGVFVCQIQAAPITQMSASLSSDMTKPTYGFHGQSGSSIGYNQKDGLSMKGQISDLLGPPLKIANGVSNIIKGSTMSGLGSGMNANSGVLSVDSKTLENMGGAELLKGGVLYGGALAKTAKATALAGLPGKLISSIIEVPIKVVALKDIKKGKALKSMATSEAQALEDSRNKAQALSQTGDNLKISGLNQVISGATEGLSNIGNAVQTTANNAASALRFLPIMMNLPEPGQQFIQQIPEGQANVLTGNPLSSGSLFSGLNNLIPGLNVGFAQNKNEANSPYAAVFNTTSPFNNLFSNPGIHPLFFPLGNTNSMFPTPANQQQQRPQQSVSPSRTPEPTNSEDTQQIIQQNTI